MMKKSRFTIDPSALGRDEGEADLRERLSPMAAAVRDAADASRSRFEEAEDLQLLQLRLAAEMKQLRDAKLDLRLVGIESIETEYLARDRQIIDPAALEELKRSIRDNGLSAPIRLEESEDGRLFLNQGKRRLLAFRALFEETGEDRFLKIPALVEVAGNRDAAYRRMVDENLVRENVSFAELAGLAIAHSEEAGVEPAASVGILYASVDKTKRSKIGAFIRVLQAIGDALAHPQALSRNLGIALASKIDDEAFVSRLKESLAAQPQRTESEEMGLIERALEAKAPRSVSRKPVRQEKFRVRPRSGEGRSLSVTVTERRVVIEGLLGHEVERDRLEALIDRLVTEAVARGQPE